LPAGRPEEHREQTTIDHTTWIVLKTAGFDFSARMREFLEGEARLKMAALGITDFSDKLRQNERKRETI